MFRLNLIVTCSALLVTATAAADRSAPWEGNQPIVEVKREIYLKHEGVGAGPWVDVRYVGPGLLREEIHTRWSASDTPQKPFRRRSSNNGRTWSSLEPIPELITNVNGHRVFWACGPQVYDAEHSLTISIWLHQPYLENRHYNHCFVRTSRDLGLTWSDPKLLRYESGDEFAADNPFNSGFLRPNQAYFGSNLLRLTDGTLVHCVAEANGPGATSSDDRRARMASLCFLGRWDADANDYRWSAGKHVEISPEVSSRGLLEPCVAELVDGRLLVVWRGSDTPKTPGRKWFSLSADQGRSLTSPAEWKYDDGSSFYSPSSFHVLLRHSVTRKLYWLGNLCMQPPQGNSPRYPLVLAEVDERIPALKRATVTRVDDRGASDSARVQLSNFSFLENRETHDFEVYLTRIGEDPNNFWGANAYKYTLQLR